MKRCMLLLILAGVPAARAQSPGTASGTLMADGARVALSQAYAFEVQDIPEQRLGNATSRLVLLLSDHPLPPGAAAGAAAFLASAQGGPVRGVLLNLTPAADRVLGGNVAGGRGQFLAQSMGAETYRIEGVQRFGRMLSGRVVAAPPTEVAFDAQFTVAVAPARPWPAPLTGAAARASPPAAAFAALLDALARKDLAAVRSGFAPDHPALIRVTQAALPSIQAEFLPKAAAPAAFMATLAKAYVADDRAALVFGNATTIVRLVRTGQGWKLSV